MTLPEATGSAGDFQALVFLPSLPIRRGSRGAAATVKSN